MARGSGNINIDLFYTATFKRVPSNLFERFSLFGAANQNTRLVSNARELAHALPQVARRANLSCLFHIAHLSGPSSCSP